MASKTNFQKIDAVYLEMSKNGKKNNLNFQNVSILHFQVLITYYLCIKYLKTVGNGN